MKNITKAPAVQSLVRGLEILELASRHERGVTLNDIAEALQVSVGAAFNLSATLTARGYLKKNTRPVHFTIGDTLMDLCFRHVESQRLHAISALLQQLSLDYPDISTLFITPATYQLIIRLRTDPTQPGVQTTFHSAENPYTLVTSLTALALLPEEDRNRILQRYPFEEFSNQSIPNRKVLEEQMQTIRNNGYALFVADQHRPRAAYPIYDQSGRLYGCLGVSLNPDSSSAMLLKTTVHPRLLAATREISRKHS
jgi:DNA-binding IclR family transcriptional regulator